MHPQAIDLTGQIIDKCVMILNQFRFYFAYTQHIPLELRMLFRSSGVQCTHYLVARVRCFHIYLQPKCDHLLLCYNVYSFLITGATQLFRINTLNVLYVLCSPIFSFLYVSRDRQHHFLCITAQVKRYFMMYTRKKLRLVQQKI